MLGRFLYTVSKALLVWGENLVALQKKLACKHQECQQTAREIWVQLLGQDISAEIYNPVPLCL